MIKNGISSKAIEILNFGFVHHFLPQRQVQCMSLSFFSRYETLIDWSIMPKQIYEQNSISSNICGYLILWTTNCVWQGNPCKKKCVPKLSWASRTSKYDLHLTVSLSLFLSFQHQMPIYLVFLVCFVSECKTVKSFWVTPLTQTQNSHILHQIFENSNHQTEQIHKPISRHWGIWSYVYTNQKYANIQPTVIKSNRLKYSSDECFHWFFFCTNLDCSTSFQAAIDIS